MTDAYSDSPPLTAEQQAVVDQPWNAWTLVTAGAGAGKTHTLVRRLDALMSQEELEAREILVLSFSRAAVRELRERIDRHATVARHVRVQTFDAWATSLLSATDPNGTWLERSYEGRITAAVDAVEHGAVEALEHGAPAHVVIDEVQDLVGGRRELVEVLIDRFSKECGFTVVGDSAQSIYGFQVADLQQRVAETNWFFDWLRSTFGEDLVELRLSENFRARTDEARTALALGPSLQHLPSNTEKAVKEAERIHRQLRAALDTLPRFDSLEDSFVRDSLIQFPGTCAILCRDYGQALRVSELLRQGHVPHRLQRSAQERTSPAWIASLLRATDTSSLSEIRFRELHESLLPRPDLDVDRLWRALRRVARGPRAMIDTAALRQVIAEGRLPDELTAAPDSRLVVSTIHRAKGLEFDRVIVLEPKPLDRPSGARRREYDPQSEARLLYVAMTRAREDLYRLVPPTTWFMRKDPRIDRWYVSGRQTYVRNGIEAGAFDIERELPAGVSSPDSGDPVELQDYLASNVHAGDELTLSLQHRLPLGEAETPPYSVLHKGVSIGVVSAGFRQDLHQLLKINKNWRVERWPAEIVGFRADEVETVYGSPAAGSRAGLGRHGVWLAPRLSGLGRFHWPEEKV